VKQALLTLLLFFQPSSVWAARDLCDMAARNAAEVTGVPADLLRAIAITETQRDGTAWPWTLNHAGQGQWFSSQDEAAAAAAQILNTGGSADLGCFQINSHWHGDAFPSLEAMLDPVENALYAARFLTELYAETGDWSAAVAAYHSRDADRGVDYLERVRAVHGALALPSESAAVSPLPQRRNRFPLFLAGDPASAGSLVPRLAGASPLVGGP
jgi:hypothetical protein